MWLICRRWVQKNFPLLGGWENACGSFSPPVVGSVTTGWFLTQQALSDRLLYSLTDCLENYNPVPFSFHMISGLFLQWINSQYGGGSRTATFTCIRVCFIISHPNFFFIIKFSCWYVGNSYINNACKAQTICVICVKSHLQPNTVRAGGLEFI